MRIALIAPLHETVPPMQYGGTERVVSSLADELVKAGHRVSLYACSGSLTKATLIECWPKSLREAGIGYTADEVKRPYSNQLQKFFSNLSDYDIVHVHHGTATLHFDFPKLHIPIVWTEHGLLDIPEKLEILRHLQQNCSIKLSAISNSQRRQLPPDIPCYGVVHNGIPESLLSPLTVKKPNYLAFIGRIDEDKGIEAAIDIARRARIPLKVAAKVDFPSYFKNKVEPLIKANDVEFVGEISDRQKSAFLSGAVALLFPVKVEEPFGLVLIEAFACGKPVIAYRRGAVAEIVVDGLNGAIVDSVAEAAELVADVASLDRKMIRMDFERRFTAERMAEGYVDLYRRALQDRQRQSKL